MRRNHRLSPVRAGLFIIWGLLSMAAAQGIAAQQRAVPQVPAGISETEILDRLRQSGMTRQQARTRLAQLGYDPGLADAYFDRLEGRGGAELTVGSDFVRALTDMGAPGWRAGHHSGPLPRRLASVRRLALPARHPAP